MVGRTDIGRCASFAVTEKNPLSWAFVFLVMGCNGATTSFLRLSMLPFGPDEGREK
jgi:hypothetical protein